MLGFSKSLARELVLDYITVTVFARMQQARHDEAQALFNAEKRGKLAVAQNALQMQMSIDDIVRLTGLNRAEIESLCNT